MRYSETLKYDAAFTIDQDSLVRVRIFIFSSGVVLPNVCFFSYLLREPVQVTGYCLHFFRYMYHSFSCVLMGVSIIDRRSLFNLLLIIFLLYRLSQSKTY